MRREDCVEMLKRIPERFHPQVCVVMQNRSVVTVDLVFRFEPTYLVLRGREGGSTDANRAFFVPYDEISYIRIERSVKVSELKRMYGEEGHVDDEDKLAQQGEVETARRDGSDTQTPPPTPSPLAPLDPAAIAKQNLLDRIRAARANAASGKLGSGGK